MFFILHFSYLHGTPFANLSFHSPRLTCRAAGRGERAAR
jgi:hypothetical protein